MEVQDGEEMGEIRQSWRPFPFGEGSRLTSGCEGRRTGVLGTGDGEAYDCLLKLKGEFMLVLMFIVLTYVKTRPANQLYPHREGMRHEPWAAKVRANAMGARFKQVIITTLVTVGDVPERGRRAVVATISGG